MIMSESKKPRVTKPKEKPKRKYVRKVKEVIEPITETIVEPVAEPENKIEGLGDVIKSVTNFFGIKSCEACEERRKKLNVIFPFLKNVGGLDEFEIAFLQRIRFANSIGEMDRNYIFSLYNKVFKTRVAVCNCPSTILSMREKLWTVYISDYSKNIDENI